MDGGGWTMKPVDGDPFAQQSEAPAWKLQPVEGDPFASQAETPLHGYAPYRQATKLPSAPLPERAPNKVASPVSALADQPATDKSPSVNQAAPADEKTIPVISPPEGPVKRRPSPNEQAAPDMTGRYNTSLSVPDEAKFQEWLEASGKQNDLFDYDLRGAWKADAQASENGHLPDTWKKPNHPTFSDQSIYNGNGNYGGSWSHDQNGKWAFQPGPTNMATHGQATLNEYFAQHEPEVDLLPASEASPEDDETIRMAAEGWAPSVVPDDPSQSPGSRARRVAMQAWEEAPPALTAEAQNTLTKIAESGGVKGYLAAYGSTALHDFDILNAAFGAAFKGGQELVQAFLEQVPGIGEQGARDVAALPEAFMGSPHPTGMSRSPRLTAPEAAAMREARDLSRAPLTFSPEAGPVSPGQAEFADRAAWQVDMEQRMAARETAGRPLLTGPAPEGEAPVTPPPEPAPTPTPQRNRPITPEQAAIDEEAGEASEPAPVIPESATVAPAPADAPGAVPPLEGETLGGSDLWRIPPDQLEAMLSDKGASDHAKLVRALGSELAAREFIRLDRKQNSPDPRRADEGAAEFDAKYGNLTPEQQRLIYGIGESDASAEDIKGVLAAHGQRHDNIEDAAYEAAAAIRGAPPDETLAVPDGGQSSTAQAAFVRLANAYHDMLAAGLSPNRVGPTIVEALVQRGGWKPNDAAEIVDAFLQKMARAAKTNGSSPGPRGLAGPSSQPDSPPPQAAQKPPPSGAYVMVAPEQLTVGPTRFQYKASGDGGVTGALHGVSRWESALANPITAWQGEDGKLYVVNGHQRTDLALRAQAAGQPDVQMPARVFREVDGYTPEYMRALGAYQNMAEGSGTAIDAAKVLRSASLIPSDRRLRDLPPKGQVVQQAAALAKLSPEAFGIIENGIVPPGYAAHVGDLIADPTEQMAALDMLARAQPANTEQARLMVRDIRDSGFLRGSQTTLFGDEDFARSLVPERARVLENALRNLRRVKGVFRAAVEGEDSLTAAGNKLDRESNIQGRTENERLLDQLQRDATTRGPISDALTAAARELAGGKPPAGVVSRFLVEARRVIRGGPDQSVRSGDLAHGAEPAGEAGPSIDLLGQPLTETNPTRASEPTVRTDPNQTAMPGMEPTAVQAQAARDAEGRGALRSDVPQQGANEGLFAPDISGQGALYSFPGMLFDPTLWRRVFTSLHPPAPPGLGHMNVDILNSKTGLPRLMAEVKVAFSPTSLKGARPMELSIRKHGADAAVSYQRAVASLWEVREAVDRLSKDEQIDFTHRMETGQPQTAPALQKVADALREVIDGWTKQVQGMGKGYLQNAVDDYMGHVWGNYQEWAAGQPAPHQSQMTGPAQAAAQGKRPLQGSGAFLKQRTFPTQLDGIKAGLIPVTYNPVDLQLLKLREMQKFYFGSKLADYMKNTGMAVWVPEGDQFVAQRDGFVKLDDRVFQPMIRGAHAAGPIVPGAYHAIEPQARLFNRYMSQGIAGRSAWYDMARAAGNALNSIQLAWPGFHTSFVTLDTANSRFALGLQQLAHGQLAAATKSVAMGVGPGAVVKSLVTGSRLRRALLDPAAASPEFRQLADDFIMAGGRLSMDQFYQSSATGSFIHGWKDFNPKHIAHQIGQMYADAPSAWRKAAAVPIQIAFRSLDTMMHPLMGLLVPRAKIGVFAEMARAWHDANPDAVPEARADAMARLWDNVEDRLGQMTYDNIFWHKALKDTAFLGFRSVGWNLGTFRAGAGAAADAGRFAVDAARLRKPEFTGRMAYGIAQFVNQALWGAMITYLLTGTGPETWLDYFFPRTGGVTPQGDPERVSIPGYVKDWIEIARDPVQTAANKLHPLLSLGQQIYSNRDYYGGIINPSAIDPDTNMFAAYGDFLANTVMPFTARGYQKLDAEGASDAAKRMSLIGFQPAPKAIVSPERGQAFRTRDDVKAYRRQTRETGRMHIFQSSP